MATGKKMGRPPGTHDYKNVPEMKQEIVAWLSEGKTLRDYCRQEGKPYYSTIYDWLKADEDFAQLFAQAREVGADVIADECLAIIDTEPLAVFDEAGNKRYDAGSIAWHKNRAEQRIKLLAKWRPQKYGDRTTIAGDDKAPIVAEVSFDIFGEMLKAVALKRHAGE